MERDDSRPENDPKSLFLNDEKEERKREKKEGN